MMAQSDGDGLQDAVAPLASKCLVQLAETVEVDCKDGEPA
jgi:hypothetical protein